MNLMKLFPFLTKLVGTPRIYIMGGEFYANPANIADLHERGVFFVIPNHYCPIRSYERKWLWQRE